MIRIEHFNLDSIVQTHYQACSNYVSPRLNFYIDLFDVLGNNNKIVLKAGESLAKRYILNDETIYSLIDPFLLKRYKQKNNKWNVNINQIKTALTTNDKHIIKDFSKQHGEFQLLNKYFIDIKKSLKDILEGKPYILDNYTKEKARGNKKECIEKAFSYETFAGKGFKLSSGKYWNNYSLTESIGISVCPYCNRNWINTVTNGKYVKENGEKRSKVTSPQLDHFFSKTDFPILRLSFYNLIPSCESCNARLKKAIKFEYGKHLHPYDEGYGNECFFETSPNDYNAAIGIGLDYKIELNTRNCSDPLKIARVKENHDVFEIDTIYKEHADIISELYRKKKISNKKYLELLQVQFPSAKLTKEELYRLAFGNYYEEIDFNKRPFAKLTKDVAEQLGLIK